MSPIIEINERHLGKMARRKHARALIEELRLRNWRAVYTEKKRPEWKFNDLAQYRRFMLAYQLSVDKLFYDDFAFPISWDCPCKEGQAELCPHGPDPLQPTPRFRNLPELRRCVACGRFVGRRPGSKE